MSFILSLKTWSSGPGQRYKALPNDLIKATNPKHEIRNAKQYLMTKIQMFQTEAMLEFANMLLFLTFGHLIFEFVSDFVLRISDFAKSPFQIMSSGLNPKPGPLDPDFYLLQIFNHKLDGFPIFPAVPAKFEYYLRKILFI